MTKGTLLTDLGITKEDLLGKADLASILTYHVHSGTVDAADISNGMTKSTVMGVPLTFTQADGQTMVGDIERSAVITTADVSASNGVIHVVDKVLLPPTVVGTAVASGFSILAEALTSANLVATLQGDGPFTVFAPTDAAFGTLLTDLGITKEDLLGRADLADILTLHVAQGKTMSADILDGMQISTLLDGASLSASVSSSSVDLSSGTTSAAVVVTDVHCSNGVIHVIDNVLLPSADNGADVSGVVSPCSVSVWVLALTLTALLIME